MAKRGREDTENVTSHKRLRLNQRDRLSTLSDELLLVLLSYLPVHDLTRCEQLSRRLRTLASDSQIWKSAYYERFVRPRAIRIPGLREATGPNTSLLSSSKLSKWLEDGYLVKRGLATNWKRQYKLRHNWSKGSCKRTETEIAERPSIPPVLVRLHDGIIITADCTAGLRAWSTLGGEGLIATMAWAVDGRSFAAPSSLAIDGSSTATADLHLSVGFLNGSFGLYTLDRRKWSLQCRYMHPASMNGTVSAIAFSFPYILTMTEAQLLSLYRFPFNGNEGPHKDKFEPPSLLSSLKSHTAWPPLSLAIRSSSTGVSTSIAYAMSTYTAGWSVGLQELRLSNDGTILESRLATPPSQGFRPLSAAQGRFHSIAGDASTFVINRTSPRSTSSSAKPTSLSYSHPYLLAAYSDNTMRLHMVTSNAQELSIGSGKSLCGHTASVSGAHVGDRGKAVSVSAGGSDLRVWELEGGIKSSGSRRQLARGEVDVAVTIAATVPIKLATAQSAVHPPATIAAKKVTSAVNAAHLKRRSRATVAAKPAIFHVNVVILPEELPQEAWAAAAGTLAALEAKNATNVEKLVT
ncbi:MAG: hypothetical protein Q9182_000903 [Xanthomendoza sp. 2 TL-2023]